MATNLDGSTTEAGYHGIPGGAEVVENQADGYWYVLYKAPETGQAMTWRIDSHEDLAGIFGPGVPWKPDEVMSWSPTNNPFGILTFGSSRELANTSLHPFDAFVSQYQDAANSQPWLRDPEVLAIAARDLLEGRTTTPDEFSQTTWWKTHGDAQRQWMGEVASDPASAAQKVRDARVQTQQLLGQLGISNAPDSLSSWLADQVTSGAWTQTYLQSQLSKLADPSAPGTLDPDLQKQTQNMGLANQTDNTTKVDALLNTWVGPTGAAGWTQQMRDDWAGKLRNDPTGEAEKQLTDQLKQQRLALLPGVPDPNVSYQAIAANWRGLYQQTMGQPPDETSALWQQALQVGSDPKGGQMGVQQLLLDNGLKTGNTTVTNKAVNDLASAFGGSQRSNA